MSKIRLKFKKTGMGKYISHLDLLRTFTRAIHRAGLPVRYSQGFNPHQLITFSLPLPIGVTSETEFVDIDFEDTVTNEVIMEKLNVNLPPDIKIISVSTPTCKANDIVAARYKIDITAKNVIDKEKTESFFVQEFIPVIKKTKKGEKEVNLKEYIREIKNTVISGETVELDIILSAGGSANIKPDILIAKYCEFLGNGEFESYNIHRTEIFYDSGKEIKNFC